RVFFWSGEAASAAHSRLHLSAAIQSVVYVFSGAPGRALSGRPGGERCLRVAVLRRGRGESPWLRHQRSQQAEPGHWHTGGLRRLGSRVARALDGAGAGFCPESCRRGRLGQSLVDGRAGKRAQLAIRPFFRYQLATAQGRFAGQALVADPGGSVRARAGARRIAGAICRRSILSRYGERRLPIAPETYRHVLEKALQYLADDKEKEICAELQSILTALQHLPGRTETDPRRVAERARKKEIIKRRLGRRCAEAPQLRQAIVRALAQINGKPGQPRSFDQLDELLNAQSYRLAFWRVASEEINYRRFFDVR